MSKTRKHKPSSRKIRKHKPTRKQTGGVCCRYEKANQGQGCDGTPYKSGNELTRTSKSPTGNPAEFENIGFEPIWFNNGKPVSFEQHASGPRGEPFFTTWKNIKFGLTYHSLKHTENLGTKCYDIENLIKVIEKMIPKLNWTRNATTAAAANDATKGETKGETKERNIFNPEDDFETFYSKLAEAPYCVGAKNCLYYSTAQKKADITVCDGYYILKNPTSINLEIGTREKEEQEFEVKLSKKDVNVAAIKLTFLRFLNKNQGGESLDKFISVKNRKEYEQTLFLYKIEVLDEKKWKDQQKILLGDQIIVPVQQVLINNASDCNHTERANFNNWIKTENGRKRNPRLFLNPWHGINVIKNAQKGQQYRKLIVVAFRDMHEAITKVQTAVSYFSDPYGIFPQDSDDDKDDEDDFSFGSEEAAGAESRYKSEQWKSRSALQGETKIPHPTESVVDVEEPFDKAEEKRMGREVAKKLEKMELGVKRKHAEEEFLAEELDKAISRNEFVEWVKMKEGKKKKRAKAKWSRNKMEKPKVDGEQKNKNPLPTLEWEKFQENYKLPPKLKPTKEAAMEWWEEKERKRKKLEKQKRAKDQAEKNKKAAVTAEEETAKYYKAAAAEITQFRRRFVPSTTGTAVGTTREGRPLIGINGAICNNPYLKNKKILAELEKDNNNKKAIELKKKLKAQKEKRPCWYQFLDSLKKFKWDHLGWDDWPEEIKDNAAIFKHINSRGKTQVEEEEAVSNQREWTEQDFATRFCTIFLFTGRKLIENFKNLLLEFPNFLSPKKYDGFDGIDEDENAEEIAKNIGEINSSTNILQISNIAPAYEKFIEDNLKLINIWNTGVRWVIDILDNPCEVTNKNEDVEWKDELNAVLPFSFINYWKKVGSLCEGENKGYPKVTEEIKTIINEEDGAESANFLFDERLIAHGNFVAEDEIVFGGRKSRKKSRKPKKKHRRRRTRKKKRKRKKTKRKRKTKRRTKRKTKRRIRKRKHKRTRKR